MHSAAREMQAQSPMRGRQSAIAKRLLLFDIDGTLIHSGGAGVRALKCAFKERFGIDDDLHDIEIAGMTDSGMKFLRPTRT
jgi:beta-phosphoglucomutase-like phosphatase (HAD superfamily)